MDDNHEAKRVLAEAISRVLYLVGKKHNDDFRNWILACSVIKYYIMEIEEKNE